MIADSGFALTNHHLIDHNQYHCKVIEEELER
jgi:hypothetical protein